VTNNHMTPDDITRLAERLDCLYGRNADEEKEIDAIVDELRTLAQQGKAGGRVFYVSADDCMFRDDWKATTPIIYSSTEYAPRGVKLVPLATPPANSPEAGVTDEMVERALAEWFSDENSRDDGPETSWAAVQKEYADGGNWLRESMGKALSAALAPQPKDAT